MKNPNFLILLLLCPVLSFGQVGIGTTTPHPKSVLDLSSNSKGLLIPRMTCAQRLGLSLTSADFGMMVFQTDIPSTAPYHPIGAYMFDGANWVAPVPNATTTGSTLRWDGSKWGPATNLFNQGSSIGIGTTSPKSQLHIHSSAAPISRMQITNAATSTLTKDGLVIGVSSTREAFINQQEQKALLFSIDSVERVRIDSVGNVGINKLHPTSKLDVNGTVQLGSNGITVNSSGQVGIHENQPIASLDVNGTVKLGIHGTSLSGIIRSSSMIDVPNILGGLEMACTVSVPDASVGATVLVSPSIAMPGLTIGYAMVSSPGNVEIKFINLATLPVDLAQMMFYITLIQ